MKIQGEHRFQAPREEVWEALLDADVLAATVPGSQGLEQTGENEYRGKLKIKVGPVQGLFEGKVSLSNLDPPQGYDVKIEGRGAPGFVNGSGRISLAEEGGATVLAYEVDAQVGGRIAGVGQRLVESSGKVITRQALEALDRQIQQRSGKSNRGSGGEAGAGGPGGDAPGSGEPSGRATRQSTEQHSRAAEASREGPSREGPSQAEFAAGFAKGMFEELVPPPYRRLAGMAGVGIVAAVLVLMIRSCA